MSIILFLAIWSFFTRHNICDCNPVPNPGVAMLIGDMHRCGTRRQQTLHDFPGFEITGHQGEGCNRSTTVAEADSWVQEFCNNPAKCGQPPPLSYGSRQHSLPSSAVQKRSYRRACKHAVLYGTTQYKGRTFGPQDFPSSLVQRITAEFDVQPKLKPQFLHAATRHPRFTAFHWNPGGMAQSTFQEFKEWTKTHPADAFVLTETRWGFNSCWSDENWSYIHSAAAESRSGGILIMIARKFCSSEHIGYDDRVPGRLLHIRMHFDKRAIDLVAVYQHTDHKTTASNEARVQLWKSLDTCLYQMPQRNNLLLAGDFNCTTAASPPWTGTAAFKWKGRKCQSRPHADQHHLMQLLRQHGLISLTAWDESTGPTYVHCDTASRIDHFFTRISSCDGQSKQVKFFPHADIIPNNLSHHIPIQCSLKTRIIPHQKFSNPTQCTYSQRASCRRAFLQESPTWLELQQTVHHATQQTVDVQSPDSPIVRIHSVVADKLQNLFSKQKDPGRTVDYGTFRDILADKWHHRRCIRRLQHQHVGSPFRRCFQAWFHWCHTARLQRLQQKQARRAKADRFEELCKDVEHAAKLHDAHTMFQTINRYSPKRPMARARLRTPEGQIANQYMAHALTVRFVQTTWQGPATLPCYSERAPEVPFSLAELETAIAASHPNKSVAPPFLPALIWKGSPAVVAEYIYGHLQRWWSQQPPIIPQIWKDAWLTFLPKPGKPNTCPSHLRPISLMEPLGKIVVGLLTQCLKSQVLGRLVGSPHFGFLPMRSATDAICRVARHCVQIRSLIGAHRRTPMQRISHAPKTTICGGLSLFFLT